MRTGRERGDDRGVRAEINRRDPDALKRGLVFGAAKQVIFNQGERVLAEGQSWSDEEAMKGGYCVYFVVRGVRRRNSCTRDIRGRTRQRRSSLSGSDVGCAHPDAITHLNNDAYSATPAIRRALI